MDQDSVAEIAQLLELAPRDNDEPGLETKRLRSALSRALFQRSPLQQLGRYELRRLIGRGGMGSVYEAWDGELDRLVALKVFEIAGDGDEQRAEAKSRLLSEARVLARFCDDNVIRVHEVGIEEDVAYIAMELVDGAHLGVWAEGLPTYPRERLARIFEVMLQACRALVGIHAHGLSHGDFKPANVLVRRDGKVLVADLGLARPIGASPAKRSQRASSSPVDHTSSLSSTPNAFVGTPSYMAPEQLAGAPATAASDCYAFCLTLTELILGERAPPPSQRERWLESLTARCPSRRLARVLRRGMATSPSARPASMVELRRQLVAAVGPHRGLRIAAFSIAGLLLLSVASLWLTHDSSRDEQGTVRTNAKLHEDHEEGSP